MRTKMSMKTGIVVVAFLAFTIWVSGQTPVQPVPVIVTWEYHGRTEPFVVRITNNSGKDIVGYVIGDRRKLADGTVDKSGYSANMSDMMTGGPDVKKTLERTWVAHTSALRVGASVFSTFPQPCQPS